MSYLKEPVNSYPNKLFAQNGIYHCEVTEIEKKISQQYVGYLVFHLTVVQGPCTGESICHSIFYESEIGGKTAIRMLADVAPQLFDDNNVWIHDTHDQLVFDIQTHVKGCILEFDQAFNKAGDKVYLNYKRLIQKPEKPLTAQDVVNGDVDLY